MVRLTPGRSAGANTHARDFPRSTANETDHVDQQNKQETLNSRRLQSRARVCVCDQLVRLAWFKGAFTATDMIPSGHSA